MPSPDYRLPKDTQGSFLLAAHCDLNGIFRGKRVPPAQVDKVLKSGIRMPMSSIGVDIWGTDVLGNDLFARGDLDGIVEPTGRPAMPLIWGSSPMLFAPMWMRLETGAPFFGDPRRVLAEVLGRYTARQITPVVAMEVEFHLIRETDGFYPVPVADVPNAHSGAADTIYCLDALADVGPFLDEVYAQAEACGIELEAVTSESGPSQYEFNLMHRADALRIADDTVYLKQIIRNTARRHGMRATFMAKPYIEHSGNGLHMHFSLLDGSGRNIFDDGGAKGTAALRHAVAGLLASMHDTTLIFAPHQNSSRRLRPGTLAPVNATWGYENRTAAVRIPGGSHLARRIEHRVAGADANPYLVIAAVLAAALQGMDAAEEPPAPADGDVENGAANAATVPADWRHAIEAFETSARVKTLFPADFILMFASCKRQELAVFEGEITPLEFRSYLHTV